MHRDLQPANVKIFDDGQVKVLDFGLAKLAAGGQTLRLTVLLNFFDELNRRAPRR